MCARAFGLSCGASDTDDRTRGDIPIILWRRSPSILALSGATCPGASHSKCPMPISRLNSPPFSSFTSQSQHARFLRQHARILRQHTVLAFVVKMFSITVNVIKAFFFVLVSFTIKVLKASSSSSRSAISLASLPPYSNSSNTGGVVFVPLLSSVQASPSNPPGPPSNTVSTPPHSHTSWTT